MANYTNDTVYDFSKILPDGYAMNRVTPSEDGNVYILCAHKGQSWKYALMDWTSKDFLIPFGDKGLYSFLGRFVTMDNAIYNIDTKETKNGKHTFIKDTNWIALDDYCAHQTRHDIIDVKTGKTIIENVSNSYSTKVERASPDKKVVTVDYTTTLEYPTGCKINSLSSDRDAWLYLSPSFGYLCHKENLNGNFDDRIVSLDDYSVVRSNINIEVTGRKDDGFNVLCFDKGKNCKIYVSGDMTVRQSFDNIVNYSIRGIRSSDNDGIHASTIVLYRKDKVILPDYHNPSAENPVEIKNPGDAKSISALQTRDIFECTTKKGNYIIDSNGRRLSDYYDKIQIVSKDKICVLAGNMLKEVTL
ncbi:MAG: hypothetical protein FWD33_03730 [Alphaproteobacteria bacterium]|nr:hypothetical protein [Alphaproteobacteria bacterium]